MNLQTKQSFSLRGYKLAPQGFRSETWINDDYVVQRRPVTSLPRWQAAYAVLEGIPDDPQEILLASEHSLWVDGDSFWARFPRFDISGSPARDHNLSPARRRDILEKVLPDLLLAEKFLESSCPSPEKVAVLENCSPRDKEGIRRWDPGYVRRFAELCGYSPPVEVPSGQSYSLEHGDWSLGNIILTDHGYRLIDWESLAWQERGSDLVHLLLHIILPSPPDTWNDILQDSESEITGHLQITAAEWRLRIYWALLREFLFWQEGRDLLRKMAWAENILV